MREGERDGEEGGERGEGKKEPGKSIITTTSNKKGFNTSNKKVLTTVAIKRYYKYIHKDDFRLCSSAECDSS